MISFHVSSDIDLIYASKSTPLIANKHPSVIQVQAIHFISQIAKQTNALDIKSITM